MLQIEYCFVQNKKNLSKQAIAWSRIELTSLYKNWKDEVSTLVSEQDKFKAFYRPTRFTEISSFSKQPVRAFKQWNEAKQKFMKNLFSKFSHWKNIFLLLKTWATKLTCNFSRCFCFNGFHKKTYIFSHPKCFKKNSKWLKIWLLAKSANFGESIYSLSFCDLTTVSMSF